MVTGNCNPIFFPIRIKRGMALLSLLTSFLAYNFSSEIWLRSAFIPLLIVASLLVIKWAAPKLPLIEISKCAATLICIHFVTHYLMENVSILFHFIGDLFIEFVCVYLFGRYWEQRCYVPSWANFIH